VGLGRLGLGEKRKKKGGRRGRKGKERKKNTGSGLWNYVVRKKEEGRVCYLLFLQEQIKYHHHQKRGEKREREGEGGGTGERRESKGGREGLPGVEPGRHGKPLPVPRMRVCC
jgi:hypothetical protein